jgi:hypothetical protein
VEVGSFLLPPFALKPLAKMQANMGRVRKTRGAYFTNLITRRAKESGINSLGLR